MISIKKALKKEGFTLIELMLVVSILLVLMGFLIPKFSAYQDKVKFTKAKNTAKQIQTAAMASYGDKNGKFDSTSVKEYIDTLTSAENATIGTLSNNDQSIAISYKSDNKIYIVQIDASSNTFTVDEDRTTSE